MKAREYKNKDNNYIIVDGGEYLSDLKKINIFVGANNSGKSRFLRQIYKSTSNDFVYNKDLNSELNDIYKSLYPKFNDLFYMNDLKSLIDSKTGDYIGRYNAFYKTISTKDHEQNGYGQIWDLQVANEIRAKMIQKNIYELLPGNSAIKSRHIYVPILRGLRHLDFQNGLDSKEDLYCRRTDLDYDLKIENGETFSGLSVYREIKRMLLGKRENRRFIREFEDFLSNSFFQNKSVTLVPAYDTDILSISINGQEDREIFNVGDGIQSIIISTFQAFKYQDENLLLCIEEPEMTMHPSMQRILIETLATKFDKLQVFLTTHSNHFLDLTYDYPDDVSVFSFEESNEKFYIKNVTSNTKILDLLGVRNSSVFLSNCVIWTEGVTDRMLIRRLLEFKNISFKEDYHYTFAEYGGSNLENFDFSDGEIPDALKVLSISKTNYLVADNDNIKGDTEEERRNPKYIRRRNIEKLLGKKHFFDGHIEIENLIPYKIWYKVVEKILKDKPGKEITLREFSEDNEKSFNEKLTKNKIGALFREYLVQSKNTKVPGYISKNDIQCLGEDKKMIMKYVIDEIEESNIKLVDFPKEAHNLINSIADFIQFSNER